MTHGSLFSGIGGFDLAAEWAGWTNVFQVEWNEYCQKILKKNFPDARIYSDIREFDGKPWRGSVDVISGGFPCQGFSSAGKRLGTDDYRYLWPEMLRVISRARPAWVVGENVTGILSMEDRSGAFSEIFPVVENRKIVRYDTIDLFEAVYTRQAKMLVSSICEDLEKEGYQVQPLAIPAASVGAPHRRERIWFVAHAAGYNDKRDERGIPKANGRQERNNLPTSGKPGFGLCTEGAIADAKSKQVRPGLCKSESGEKRRGRPGNVGGEVIADANHKRREEQHVAEIPSRPGRPGGGMLTQWDEWTTEPPVCGMDDGIPHRVDRIRGLGNAVVPQLVYRVFDTINKIEQL